MGRKLRLTLLSEQVSNRARRLADESKKTMMSLLEMKRKIKERMAKDSGSSDMPPGENDAGIDDELTEYYQKIFGDSTA
jgi:hypothetical protein